MEYRIISVNGELYHHGTKGQKWGVRNYQNKDGSYKPGAEGRYDPDSSGSSRKRNSSSNDKSNSKNSKEKKGMSDKTKRNLKIAAAVVGTAAVAAGTAYAVKKLNVKATDILKEQDRAKASEYFKKANASNQKAYDLINATDRIKTGKATLDDRNTFAKAMFDQGRTNTVDAMDKMRLGKATDREKSDVISRGKQLSEALNRSANESRITALNLQKRADYGNYSTRDKINALKNNTKKAKLRKASMAGVSTIKINRTPVNRTGLNNYSMKDLSKLDLY